MSLDPNRVANNYLSILSKEAEQVAIASKGAYLYDEPGAYSPFIYTMCRKAYLRHQLDRVAHEYPGLLAPSETTFKQNPEQLSRTIVNMFGGFDSLNTSADIADW